VYIYAYSPCRITVHLMFVQWTLCYVHFVVSLSVTRFFSHIGEVRQSPLVLQPIVPALTIHQYGALVECWLTAENWNGWQPTSACHFAYHKSHMAFTLPVTASARLQPALSITEVCNDRNDTRLLDCVLFQFIHHKFYLLKCLKGLVQRVRCKER